MHSQLRLSESYNQGHVRSGNRRAALTVHEASEGTPLTLQKPPPSSIFLVLDSRRKEGSTPYADAPHLSLRTAQLESSVITQQGKINAQSPRPRTHTCTPIKLFNTDTTELRFREFLITLKMLLLVSLSFQNLTAKFWQQPAQNTIWPPLPDHLFCAASQISQHLPSSSHTP